MPPININNTNNTTGTTEAASTAPVSYSRAPSIAQVDRGRTLKLGHKGPAVSRLQEYLNEAGAKPPLQVDGSFGPATQRAVKALQRRQGLTVDGLAGPRTHGALRPPTDRLESSGSSNRSGNSGSGNPTGPVLLDGLRDNRRNTGVVAGAPRPERGAPSNKTATFDTVTNRGQRNQRADGRVTINGHTYNFRSGGRGRGNLPAGTYEVTRHRDYRNDKPTMVVGGEGYSFALSNKYDSRVGDTRTLLRIHPDGLGPGTIGCMGIVGDASVQRRFREDMLTELRRNGGSFNLRVGL